MSDGKHKMAYAQTNRVNFSPSNELTRLMKQVGPDVRRRIAAKTPSRFRAFFDVDDVMQETYSQAFVEFRNQRPPRAFDRWLYRVADNNLKDLIRYCEAKKRYPESDTRSPDDVPALVSQLTNRGGTPSYTARINESCLLLKAEIAKLSPSHRNVLTYYDLQQLPIDRVAALLNCTIGAAFMRRNAALLHLRRRLKLLSIEV